MDKFFDRLGDMLSSILGQDSRTSRSEDTDMQDAWDELDAYLNDEEPENSDNPGRTNRETGTANPKEEDRIKLTEDYANLEVPFGTSFDVVKTQYKSLVRKYHPDINASDPEKLKTATEIMKKLNNSYQRIKSFEKTGYVVA